MEVYGWKRRGMAALEYSDRFYIWLESEFIASNLSSERFIKTEIPCFKEFLYSIDRCLVLNPVPDPVPDPVTNPVPNPK